MGKRKSLRKTSTVAYESLKEELTGATDLLNAQVSAGLDASEVKQSLFASTKARIEQLVEPTRPQLTELTKLCSGGPWTPDQTRELAKALGTTLVGATAALPVRRANQSCPFFRELHRR